MADFLGLNYTPVFPGADSNTYVLFDSTSSKQVGPNALTGALLRHFKRYVLILRNQASGTVIAETMDDTGAWRTYWTQSVGASNGQRANQIGVPTEGLDSVRVSWVNGGSAQGDGTTWTVRQALDDSNSTGFYVDSSGTSQAVTNNPQLPPSLGQKTMAQSLSVVQASDALGQKPQAQSLSITPSSDGPLNAATSLRGAVRGETYAIAANTVSQTFAVPPAWLGKIVEFYADGVAFYYQISLSATPAVCDSTQASNTSGSPIALAAQGNECMPIANGTVFPVQFPATAQTFAVQAGAASSSAKLRMHLAQS